MDREIIHTFLLTYINQSSGKDSVNSLVVKQKASGKGKPPTLVELWRSARKLYLGNNVKLDPLQVVVWDRQEQRPSAGITIRDSLDITKNKQQLFSRATEPRRLCYYPFTIMPVPVELTEKMLNTLHVQDKSTFLCSRQPLHMFSFLLF